MKSSQILFTALLLLPVAALAQVTIASPSSSATSISAVQITASAAESGSDWHLEVWDNGNKLGNVFASSVNAVYVLPNGSHTLSVNAVSSSGTVLNSSSVNYTVAETCSESGGSSLCNMDQFTPDSTQIESQNPQNGENPCGTAENPPQEDYWTADACQGGIENGGTFPTSISAAQVSESGTIPDVGNTTLNGQSLHLSLGQESGTTNGAANGYSNVIFKVDSPPADDPMSSTTDTHWTLDEYVYLPNALAHQAFEVDSQYVTGGVWTKFYTECQFNIGGATGTLTSTGYWAVFDVNTGGWIVLNGQTQGNQKPPTVPCTREQFAEPWAYSASANPSFSGWHHIVWNFLRNSDGTVTYQSLTFDGQTTPINFSPANSTGGSAGGVNFSTLVQLDGADNTSGNYDTVDAYVNEVNITHTP